MKFDEMQNEFDKIIKTKLNKEDKQKKIEPLLIKYKHHAGILYKGFYKIFFSYNTTKENFTKKIIELLKKEY